MAQTKSYLSIQSLGSEHQYQTPTKYQYNNLNTNYSLAFSQTMGSLDTRKLNTQQTFFRSSQLRQQPINQNMAFDLRQQQYQNQNSSMTLNPVITQYDISQFYNIKKMIEFLGSKSKYEKAFIKQKSKVIEKLIEKRAQLQLSIKQTNVRFEKKRSKLIQQIQKHKEKRDKRLKRSISEIKQIKEQIRCMKKRLSLKANQQKFLNNKNPPSHRQKSHSYKNKIYIPYHAIPQFENQMYSHNMQYKQPFYIPKQMHNYYQRANKQSLQNQAHQYYPQTASRQSRQHYSNYNTIQQLPSSFPINRSYQKNQNRSSKTNILSIIQQKINQPSNMFFSHRQKNSMKSSKQLKQIKQSPIIDQLKQVINTEIMCAPNSGFIHGLNVPNTEINMYLANADNKQENGLSYFNDQQEEHESLELIANSNVSKQKNSNIRKSNNITVDKWDKKQTKQDMDMIKLIKQSQSKQQRNDEKVRLKSQKSEKSEKNQYKIKIIQTTNNHSGQAQNSPQINEQLNHSTINIKYELNQSGESPNKNNTSKYSSNKNSERRQNQRQQICQSSVHIYEQQKSNSIKSDKLNQNTSFQSSGSNKSIINNRLFQQQSPSRKTSKNYNQLFEQNLSPSNNKRKQKIPHLNLQKLKRQVNIQRIQQVTSRIEATNLRDENHYENQKTVESRYSQSQKDGLIYSAETGKQHIFQSQKYKRQSQLSEIPLKKPPSLTELQKEEVDDDDDIVNSIKLNADSRISRESHKLSRFQEQQEDEFNLNLTVQSKISRAKNSFLQNSNEIIAEKELKTIKMTTSDIKQSQMVNIGEEDSALRQSTRSSIMKKGSAIQKSIHKAQQSNNQINKSQRRSINISRLSPELSNLPIYEEQQEQQVNSMIHKKTRKRYGSNLQ